MWRDIKEEPPISYWRAYREPFLIGNFWQDDDGKWHKRWVCVARKNQFDGTWEMESRGMSGVSGGMVVFQMDEPTHFMEFQPQPKEQPNEL